MRNRTILFVDDELKPNQDSPAGHNYMWYYTNECRVAGYLVREARGIEEAMSELDRGSDVDLVVADMMMPISDAGLAELREAMEAGLVAARALFSRCPHVPVLILTNANAAAQATRLRQIGNVSRILHKLDTPPSVLVREISAILDRTASTSDAAPMSHNDEWRSLIIGKKQAAFEKFLSRPDELSIPEFLLLSELNHDLIRRLMSVASPEIKGRLKWARYTDQQLLSDLSFASSPIARGEMLEELLVRLFGTIPGFEVNSRIRTETEEIDVFILNGSNDIPWRDVGPVLICECKNWSSKCGTPEYDHFESKVRNRFGQCRCGFIVSWNGFTEKFTEQRLRSSREGFVIVELDGNDVRESVTNQCFDSLLRSRWIDAVRT